MFLTATCINMYSEQIAAGMNDSFWGQEMLSRKGAERALGETRTACPQVLTQTIWTGCLNIEHRAENPALSCRDMQRIRLLFLLTAAAPNETPIAMPNSNPEEPRELTRGQLYHKSKQSVNFSLLNELVVFTSPK